MSDDRMADITDPEPDQARIDRDTARSAARGARADARDSRHPNDPLRPRDRQQDPATTKPMDTGPGQKDSYSGMEHPAVPMPVTDQGWDNVVADTAGYRYVQSHWSDALEASGTEHRQLQHAADAEVERLHYEIEELSSQRDAWMVQRQAHALAADALETIRAEVRGQQDRRGSEELALAEKAAQAERRPQAQRPGRY